MPDAAEQTEIKAAPTMKRRWARRCCAMLAWIYLLSVVGIWLYLRLHADRSPFGMVVVFSPRWVAALPLIVLLPLALMFNRRSIWILTIAAGIALFPVMGLCTPWKALMSSESAGTPVRVLTCNIHHRAVDPAKLSSLISSVNPDIVLIQEWMPKYQPMLFGDSKWNCVTKGEDFLATRFPIGATKELPKGTAVQYRIETPAGMIDLLNVHLSSPHLALRDAVQRKSNGKPDLIRNLANRRAEAEELNRVTQNISAPLLIVGDFNLPADSVIYRENLAGFSDAFSTAGLGFGWTYYSRWTTTRIDHVLSNGRWVCRHCWVGPDVGSPHRPLIADMAIK